MVHVNGVLVISLDFELYWGLRDAVKLEEYRDYLVGVRTAIPEILKLFKAYRIHATWATVGMLLYRTKSDLIKNLPVSKTGHKAGSPASCLGYIASTGENEEEDPFHYALSMAGKIASTPGQEIGSHTFAHYCCLDEGQDVDGFKEDLKAFSRAARQISPAAVESIVFPKHQYGMEFLIACREHGIRAFRGNERAWYYRPVCSSSFRSPVRRLLRFLDSYINLSGHNTYVAKKNEALPLNIPSSRFLRPYSEKLRLLEPLKLKRILTGMNLAARRRQVYHLWWHPHNFGLYTDKNLSCLESILKHFTLLHEEYGMESLNMRELAEKVGIQ